MGAVGFARLCYSQVKHAQFISAPAATIMVADSAVNTNNITASYSLLIIARNLKDKGSLCI